MFDIDRLSKQLCGGLQLTFICEPFCQQDGMIHGENELICYGLAVKIIYLICNALLVWSLFFKVHLQQTVPFPTFINILVFLPLILTFLSSSRSYISFIAAYTFGS